MEQKYIGIVCARLSRGATSPAEQVCPSAINPALGNRFL